MFRLEELTRLLLLVELSAWTSCLSNFTETETGVEARTAGNGSSTRSTFTIVSEAMTVSTARGGRGGSKTISLDRRQDVVKQDL